MASSEAGNQLCGTLKNSNSLQSIISADCHVKTSCSNDETDQDSGSPVTRKVMPVAALSERKDGKITVLLLTDCTQGESSTDPGKDMTDHTQRESSTDPEKDMTDHTQRESSTDLVKDVKKENISVPLANKSDTAKTTDRKRRFRFTDRKFQSERYLTQPTPQLIPEKSVQFKHRLVSRHMTQPVTPDEMKEVVSAVSSDIKMSGGSIAERLRQLKTSGEENWKRRVTKDADTPLGDFKIQKNGGLSTVLESSISERLTKLEVSAEQWKERVEETDVKNFTVASRLTKKSGSESPLVVKILASAKKDLPIIDDKCPVNSPSSHTIGCLPKVPLPKEIVADPLPIQKPEEPKAKQKTESAEGRKEARTVVTVKIPAVDEAGLEQFFFTSQMSEATDSWDISMDDFFTDINETLPTIKKIRPTRRKRATTRNPLKTYFLEIRSEYEQVITGTGGRDLCQMKREGSKSEIRLAEEVLAALTSTEDFSRVELRKTEPSSLPPSLASRPNPYCDLMLLHVKGRRNVQTRLVEPSSKSINAGDCFILVTPKKIILWVGEYSNVIEKAKAKEIATFIQQKRDLGYRNSAVFQTVEQENDELEIGKQFWAMLQGDKECQDCGPEEEDELFEKSITKTNMVYRLSNAALHPYEQYWGSIPRHEMLQKNELLVFDFGSEFYVWQGTGVSHEERKQGMALALKLWEKGYDYSECAINPIGPLRSEEDGGIAVKASTRPDWGIFGKVNQNMETVLFREKFADWPDKSQLIGIRRRRKAQMCVGEDIKAFDVQKMILVNDSPVTLLLDGAHVGRGKKWYEDMQGFMKEQDILTLDIKVWHILEYAHSLLPETSYGQFHDGDSYVVRWQYMIVNTGLRSLKGKAAHHSLTGRERSAYFFWLGQDSTINEKGASALMTMELDEERGPHVRVVQGKEPPCFLNLFNGSMIIHTGKRQLTATQPSHPFKLFCLRGDEVGEICLHEIPVSTASLRSRSSLVLLNVCSGKTYVWHGCKSLQHSRQLAVCAVESFKRRRPEELGLHRDAVITILEMEEGTEKREIWSALDRDRSLYHSLMKDPECYSVMPRLFYMTSVSMTFEVTEVMNPSRLPGVVTPFPFFQADLYKASQPALFLLDVGHCVYLWQGWWPQGDELEENVHTGSATSRHLADRRCAMETTLNYCRERAVDGLIPDAYLVCAGVEPLVFQNLFPYWEVDTVVHNQALQEGKTAGYCERVEDVYIRCTQTRYTLSELQDRPLPDDVDPRKLESYLPDEEFEEVLGMKHDQFYALPSWKQRELKLSHGLY